MRRIIDNRSSKAAADLEGSRSLREELDSTLGALRGALNDSLRWRAWVERNPWTALLAATVIGLRLGRGRWL